MKGILLLSTFLIFGASLASAQSSFQEKLKVRNPENAKYSEIKIFPNPVTSYLSLSDNKLVKEIVLFNLVGTELKRFEYENGEKYYVGDLTKGMYLVQMIDEDSEVLRTQRITKR